MQTLMGCSDLRDHLWVLGLAGMAPGPNTSRPRPKHNVYPYLLRGVNVTRPNQVWSMDITYIRTGAWVWLLGGSD